MDEKTQQLLRFNNHDFELKNKQVKYQGFFKLEQYQLQHRLYRGGMSELITREIFERGDAVVVVPYDPKTDTLVMVEQFRPGAIRTDRTPWLLEFVAGMFSEDESPVDVAIREAKEEANLTLVSMNLIPIMNYFSSPGGMSEQIHLYLGLVDSREAGGVYGLDEEHEDILVHQIKRERAYQLLVEGKITNAATVIGLQWLQLNYHRYLA